MVGSLTPGSAARTSEILKICGACWVTKSVTRLSSAARDREDGQEGRAIAEVGAVMIVGGNIDGVTRVMTTTIALETSKGDLPLALGLGMLPVASGAIAGIDAVDVITSISRAEQSQISVRFRLEKDADAAAACQPACHAFLRKGKTPKG